jgi:hypothetical protein
MRAGTIGSAEQVIKPGFHYHASTVVFGKLQKLSAEPVSVADDRVDEVLCRLPLDSDYVLYRRVSNPPPVEHAARS